MESEDRKPIFTKRLILIILAVILIALIIFLLLRKCGNNSGVSSDLSVELSAYSLNLKVGDVYNISATTHPENQVVTWSSDNQLVAAVDANGSIYAQSVGVAVITATASNGKEANCFVTVFNNFPELTGILLDKTKYTLKVGGLTIASVTPQPEGAQTPMLNYVVANTSVATIDQSGVIRGVSAGTTTLTVSTQDGKFQASAVIIVTDKTSGNTGNNTGSTTLKPVSVELTGGTSKTLTVGETYVIPFKVNPADAEQAVVCTSSSSSIAKVNDCKVTAVAAGSTTIKVCSKQNTKICTQLSITVKAKSSGSGSGNTGGNGGNTGGNTGTNITKDDVPVPNLHFGCSTATYKEGDWCKWSVGVRVSGLPDEVEAIATCVTTGSTCTPTNTTSLASASTSGTYVACAAYRQSGVMGNAKCTKATKIQIDKTAPTCSVTMGDEKYTFTVSDKESGIDTASATRNGQSIKLTNNQYSAKGNDGSTYTFAVKDKAGNSCSKTETFVKPPSAPSISFACGTESYNGTTWCKNGLAVYVSGVPSGATKKQCRVQGTEGCDPFTATYSTITTSGTYTVCAAYTKDGVNSKTGCKEITAKIDSQVPTCTLTKTGNVLAMNVTNVGKSGIKEATFDGTIISGFSGGWTKTVTKAGTYTFVVKTNSGTSCTKSITVSSSDLPKVSAPSISVSNSSIWTNKNITVSISSATADATIKACYSTNGNVCTNYTTRVGGTITITANGTYNVCAIAEKDGIKSSPRCHGFTVSKIDKTNPTCDMKVTEGVREALLTVTVTENASGIASITSGYTNTADKVYVKSVSTTGSHSFKVTDYAGNQGTCSATVKEKVYYSYANCKTYGDYKSSSTTVSSCNFDGVKGTSLKYITCNGDKYRATTYKCTEGSWTLSKTEYVASCSAVSNPLAHANTNNLDSFVSCESITTTDCFTIGGLSATSCYIRRTYNRTGCNTYSSSAMATNYVTSCTAEDGKKFRTRCDKAYTKTTYTASSCQTWGTASAFSTTKPTCANDNLTCKLTTREVLAGA